MAEKKKNGKGNGVREIRPGVYAATMYDPRAKGGTKHVGTFTAAQYGSRAAARKAGEEAKREAERVRDLQLKAESSEETVEQFARRWMRDYPRPKDSTIRHYDERTKAFVRDFGDRPMIQIERDEARAWIVGGIVPEPLRKIARGWHDAKPLPGGDIEVPSHKGNLRACRAMFNDWLDTFRGEHRNPFDGMKIPQSQGRGGENIEIITQAELNELVEQALKVHGEYGPHFAAIIEIAAWTGMRPGEMWALRQDQVDFENRLIYVHGAIDKQGKLTPPKTKTGYRAVTMLSPAEHALRAAIGTAQAAGEYEAVFVTARGKPFRYDSLFYYWNPVRCAAGRPGMDFYELRHRFGTHLARVLRRMPYEIADQMGHADGGKLAMKRYIHGHREASSHDAILAAERESLRRSVDESVEAEAAAG